MTTNTERDKMCCVLFMTGEVVKLANGNPTLGTVVHNDEPWQRLQVLENAVLVTWKNVVPSGYGYLVICKYYSPNELIHA